MLGSNGHPLPGLLIAKQVGGCCGLLSACAAVQPQPPCLASAALFPDVCPPHVQMLGATQDRERAEAAEAKLEQVQVGWRGC